MTPNQIEIFFSYSIEDVKLRDELAKHLRGLERRKVITAWHESEISAGQERRGEIERHLNSASIILLLISPDYIAEDELWEHQVTLAMERHYQKKARVIPVLLRDYHGWEKMPLGELQPLPMNGKPITDESWPSQDAAFKNVVRDIEKAVREVSRQKILADPTKPFIIKLFRLIPWFFLFKAFATSSGVSIAVMLMRLLTGIFEPSELWFYDQMMSFQRAEEQDENLLMLQVTPNDIQKYGRPKNNASPLDREGNLKQDSLKNVPLYGASLPDSIIYTLLKNLLDSEAAVIGFDIYRDYPAYHQGLKDLLKNPEYKDRLIFICKMADTRSNNLGRNPPPDIDMEQVGFSDLVADTDGTIRRQLLQMNSHKEANKSNCKTKDEKKYMESFALKVANKYLEVNHKPKFRAPSEEEDLTNNSISLKRLQIAESGGYKLTNDIVNARQILLRYRKTAAQKNTDKDSTFNIAETVTVDQLLGNILTLENKQQELTENKQKLTENKQKLTEKKQKLEELVKDPQKVTDKDRSALKENENKITENQDELNENENEFAENQKKLKENQNKLNDLVKDKIILIGAEAEAYECPSPTPFSNRAGEAQMRGLYIQAHKISQIVNAAAEKERPLLTVWDGNLSVSWIMFWAALGAIFAHVYKDPKQLTIVTVVSISILYIFCLGLFIGPTKKWVPFTPAVIAYLSAVGIIILIEYQSQKIQSISNSQ